LLDKLVNAERGDAGDEIQGEALEFPDPDRWPQPVDGFELVYEIRDLLHRHIVLPPGAGWAVAVWCVHTFLLGITEHTPRLAVVSPERGCGKTTLLDLLGRLVCRPLLAANLTPAATFRVIARHRPSLLIDEADTFLRDNEELRGVLNAGHRYDGFVLRTVGEAMEPRRFNVFGPVAIALIGNLPGTLADRSITVRMRRAAAVDAVGPIRQPTHAAAVTLVRKAHRWAADHREKLRLWPFVILLITLPIADPAESDGRRRTRWRRSGGIADD
jgi:putative DNA primase/helicase